MCFSSSFPPFFVRFRTLSHSHARPNHSATSQLYFIRKLHPQKPQPPPTNHPPYITRATRTNTNIEAAAALRGVAIQRGRAARAAAYPAAAAAAAAFARLPAPMAAAGAANAALHGYAP